MIAFALTLLCCLTAPAEVSIDKEILVLGDLIEFPDGDLRRTLPLGRAPDPGLARRLHDYEILGKLKTSGLRSDDLELPESVLIRRRSAKLGSEQVWNEVSDLFGRTYPDGRIEILDLQVPAIDVATGGSTLQRRCRRALTRTASSPFDWTSAEKAFGDPYS